MRVVASGCANDFMIRVLMANFNPFYLIPFLALRKSSSNNNNLHKLCYLQCNFSSSSSLVSSLSSQVKLCKETERKRVESF